MQANENLCTICNKPTELLSGNKKKYKKTCSPECRSKHASNLSSLQIRGKHPWKHTK